MERVRVVVGGRVQGVGYRYWVAEEARALGLSGWVCNRSDGRVEAEFQGPRALLDEMLTQCRRGPMFARVTELDAEWLSALAEEFREFTIRG